MIGDNSVERRARRAGHRTDPLTTAAVLIVAVVVLYVGAGIFVPLVLAVLLAFALTPLVNRLRRWGVPHVAAVIVSVLLAGAVLAALAYVVATQLVGLAAQLPKYQATVTTKLKGLQAALGGANFFEQLGAALNQLRAQVSPPVSAGALSAGPTTPLPVSIANTPENPLGMVQSILGSALGPLATAAIVAVFLVFLLLERADVRDRFLKLVSRGDLRTSTKVMDDAAARVGRYLLVQFSVNLTYGLILGTGLALIGVPNGILWGLLATVFRYIPFVGTLIVATIPFMLAFAVDPGWSMLLKSVALYVLLELTTTNVIEPRLYGSSTGLSPLAVLLAAMFWATLWGPIGLILSTPLTVCLVVVGRYVPQLQFLETLLGSQPVLRPEERLYQRLVAGNTDEALELAELSEGGTGSFYENVAIPALRLADADLSADPADLVQRRRVMEGLEEVIEELEEEVGVGEENAGLLLIGGRTEIDGVAARVVASLLHRAGMPAKMLPPVAVRREALRQLDTAGITAVCLVYLGRNAKNYSRFVVRRLKREHPEIRVAVALLGAQGEAAQEIAAENLIGADAVVTDVAATTRLLLEWQQPAAAAAADEAAAGADDDRLRELRLRVEASPRVSRLLKHAADRFSVAVAVATIAEAAELADRAGQPSGEKTPDSLTLIERVMQRGDVLVIADAFKDKQFAEDAFLLERGVRFFAGVPLRRADGLMVGVMSLMDEMPREFGESEQRQLSELARELMSVAEPPQGLPPVHEPSLRRAVAGRDQ